MEPSHSLLEKAAEDFICHFEDYLNTLIKRTDTCIFCGYDFQKDKVKKISSLIMTIFSQGSLCADCAKKWLTLRQGKTYKEREAAYMKLSSHSFLRFGLKLNYEYVFCFFHNRASDCPWCPVIEKVFYDPPTTILKSITPPPAAPARTIKPNERTEDIEEDIIPSRPTRPTQPTQPSRHNDTQRRRSRKRRPPRDDREDDTRSVRSAGTRTVLGEIMDRMDDLGEDVKDLGRKVEDIGAPAPPEIKKRSIWKKLGTCWRCFSSPCSTCMQTCGRKTGQCCTCCGQCLEDCCNPED